MVTNFAVSIVYSSCHKIILCFCRGTAYDRYLHVMKRNINISLWIMYVLYIIFMHSLLHSIAKYIYIYIFFFNEQKVGMLLKKNRYKRSRDK